MRVCKNKNLKSKTTRLVVFFVLQGLYYQVGFNTFTHFKKTRICCKVRAAANPSIRNIK